MITLATLFDATEQEVFDQVVEHLKKQRVRCVDNHGFCRYRGRDGLKCAAGCLISDDEYDPKLENHAWQTLTREKLVPDCHSDLIEVLQAVHDQYHPLSYHGLGSQYMSWKEGLSDCAKSRGLKFDADSFC